MFEKIKGWGAGLIFRLIALLTLGQISPILSACMIIEQDGKFLLIDRTDGLGYTFPGGIVRYKETVEQCILRETFEETGFGVIINGFVGIYSALDRDPRLRAVSIAYKGAIVDGALRASSEGKPAWYESREVSGHMAFDCEAMLKDYLSGRQSYS